MTVRTALANNHRLSAIQIGRPICQANSLEIFGREIALPRAAAADRDDAGQQQTREAAVDDPVGTAWTIDPLSGRNGSSSTGASVGVAAGGARRAAHDRNRGAVAVTLIVWLG